MSDAELDKVSEKEWDDLREEVQRIGARTSRWAGGLSVLSFFILAALALGVSSLKDIARTVDENRLDLAVPRYTKAHDDDRREEDWAQYRRERKAENDMFQRELDRRQEWINEQDKFRLQMVEFAAETRQSAAEGRRVVDELRVLIREMKSGGGE